MKPYPDPLPRTPEKALIKQFTLSYDTRGLSKEAVATFNQYVHDVVHARNDLAGDFKLRIVCYRSAPSDPPCPLGYRRLSVRATKRDEEDVLTLEFVRPVLGALRRLRSVLSNTSPTEHE